MKLSIFREFTFDSAHFLPHVPEGHKCKRLHGHTYRLKVYLSGELNREKGWVEDFGEMKKSINPIIEQLDHYLLNDISGLENPTVELLALWIGERLENTIKGIEKIELWETPNAGTVLYF